MTLTNLKTSLTTVGNQIGHLEKIASSGVNRKPLEPGLKLKIQVVAEFCHPSCDIKFAGTR